MSAEQWLLLVGLRVLDLGLLAVWLVWFFRRRDAGEDDPPDDGGGGPGRGPSPGSDPRGPGKRLPQAAWRPRSHHGRRHPGRRSRLGRPAPRPVPARVRRPRTPVPAHRRA